MSSSESSSPDVLIVDDNEDLLELATRALRKAGIAVAAAKDFEQLDSALAAMSPRLILMDVQMPELYGDDVAAVLRDRDDIDARIVLWSSLDTAELENRARDAGLDGAISKTAGVGHLVHEVRRLLADESA